MALLPDRGRMMFTEENVDVEAALEPDAAYDLTLFRELGNPSRGVLVVTIIMNYIFKDGVSKTGGELTWTETEMANFMSDTVKAIKDKWSDKHRITTTGSATIKDIGVVFDLDARMDIAIFDHSHWNLTVVKADDMPVSSVCNGGGSFISNGEVNLDSQDLKWKWNTQRGIVHEFGHMLGYRDEYVNSSGNPEDNPHWTADSLSVMNSGEVVCPRHYVLFTPWLNEQFRPGARLLGKDTKWLVSGQYDILNAYI